MRITVCELPHEPKALATAWNALCEHTVNHQSEMVLLPEFAFAEPLWESELFSATQWKTAEALCDSWIARLGELQVPWVVGARPVTMDGQHYNEGFAWSRENGYTPLRRKFFLPDEPGGWEARWFARGDRAFPKFNAGELSFGLNICTELWALETYGAYALLSIDAILSPRATAAATTDKWLSAGTVAAVRSGAYSLSSNRVHADGSCGGVGWIISPDGALLAKTSRATPFCTVDIDLTAKDQSRQTYPRYVFAAVSGTSG